jgi:hypothetical protein
VTRSGARPTAWELRALAAADDLDEACATQAGVATNVAALYASLHLPMSARSTGGSATLLLPGTDLGGAAIGDVGDDGSAAMIIGSLDTLAHQLSGR